MTYTDDDTAIVNRALQSFGTRTTVTTAQMNALSSNEAKQANIVFAEYRDQLLRLAPWDCGVKCTNLIYITSSPGTPENTSPATNFWQPGQPAPPYAYEYFYPNDCLRACWLIPSPVTSGIAGVPITTAVTGWSATYWQGQPVKFKVSLDDYFREATGVTIAAGGSGYAINDIIILGTDTLNSDFNSGLAPAGIIQVKVTGVSGGAVSGATLQPFGGTQVNKTSMLFATPGYTLKQVWTSGLGSGAQMNVSGVSATKFAARAILTDQEFAAMAYVRQVTDPNVMDPMFKEAWAYVLGAHICVALTGDKAQANMCIQLANRKIEEARKVDGNEGLTVNNITPDFIRIRGITTSEYYNGPWNQFDWGSYWPAY